MIRRQPYWKREEGRETASEGGVVKKRFAPTKNANELPRACFPKVQKITGFHEVGHQLDPLHIYTVP